MEISYSCLLNLFKSWSNLGFDQDSNGHKYSEKTKNGKSRHIVLLCHIYSKHSIKLITRSRHIQTRKIMYQATPNPKLCLMKSSMKRSTCFFGFKHGNFKNPLKSFILE